MKFAYCYKTSDGVRHEDGIDAPSRDAAFAALRERGIRPIKVVAKDGTKANGEVRGVRRRVVAFCVAAVALVAGLAAFFAGRTATRNEQISAIVLPDGSKVTLSTAQPLARQRIPGDRMRIENAPTNLFNSPAEVFLSKYAEPGRAVDAARLSAIAASPEEFAACLKEPIRYASSEFTEHVDLKRIVAGMKREMKAYLAGGGTAEAYLAELVKRQKMEIAYREKAEKRLGELLKDPKEAYGYWLKANAHLQSMGIYPLALPDALRAYQLSVDIEE